MFGGICFVMHLKYLRCFKINHFTNYTFSETVRFFENSANSFLAVLHTSKESLREKQFEKAHSKNMLKAIDYSFC